MHTSEGQKQSTAYYDTIKGRCLPVCLPADMLLTCLPSAISCEQSTWTQGLGFKVWHPLLVSSSALCLSIQLSFHIDRVASLPSVRPQHQVRYLRVCLLTYC